MPDAEVKDNFFSSRIIDGVLIVDFRKNLLIHRISLNDRDTFFSYLDSIASYDPVKVIILHSYLEETGHKEYMNFFHCLKSGSDFLDLHRLCNIYASLILKIIGLNKIVIHITSGNVISLFLNLSLACDYRIAAENTVFKNSFIDAGMLPIGGGPFFLSRKIGSGKAHEIMTLKKEYDVSEAFKYGLVDKIVPLKDLETEAIKLAGQFKQVPAQTLNGIKQLFNYSLRDLQDYLDFEHKEIFKIVRNSAFNHYASRDR